MLSPQKKKNAGERVSLKNKEQPTVVCFKFEQPHEKSALTFLNMSGFFTTRLLFETNFSEVPLSPSAKQPLRATTSPASTKYLGGRRYDELFVEIGGFNMVNMVVKYTWYQMSTY